MKGMPPSFGNKEQNQHTTLLQLYECMVSLLITTPSLLYMAS